MNPDPQGDIHLHRHRNRLDPDALRAMYIYQHTCFFLDWSKLLTRFCPNLRKTAGSEGKKRKNVAKCFGLFQRKMHKKGLPGVWEAKF